MGGDEGSLGDGPCIVAGFGFRFAARASVELDVLRAQHQRNIAGGPLEGTATGVFGDVVYYFTEGRTQAFAMGGVGVLNAMTTHQLPETLCTPTPTGAACGRTGRTIVIREDGNNIAWSGGAGVKIFVKPQVSLQPQLRMIFSEVTGVMGLSAASVALGYHW